MIVPKGLAAFGSIDILHKKHTGTLAFQSAFMCKVFSSLCDGNLLALWITKWGNSKKLIPNSRILWYNSRDYFI
jgi:hypothetical protein